jgi:hypothetical protein
MSSSFLFFGSLTSELYQQAIETIDCDQIVKQVLDLFEINYQQIDGDADFILSKMKYVFEKKPPVDEAKKKVQFEIECLKKANATFMNYIWDPRNRFSQME